MDNNHDFKKIMDRIKNILNLKSDGEIAEKLELSKQNYSEKKRKNSIPYENLINLCEKENISTDFLFYNKGNFEKNTNYKIKLEKSINKLNEKESKYFYHIIESKLAEKELN